MNSRLRRWRERIQLWLYRARVRRLQRLSVKLWGQPLNPQDIREAELYVSRRFVYLTDSAMYAGLRGQLITDCGPS